MSVFAAACSCTPAGCVADWHAYFQVVFAGQRCTACICCGVWLKAKEIVRHMGRPAKVLSAAGCSAYLLPGS